MSAEKIDIETISSWDEAIQAFPCPNCSTNIGKPHAKLSPGFKLAGHSHRSGNLVRICFVCQPDSMRDQLGSRHESLPESVARRLIDRRYPVRYVWDWEGGSIPVVRDRADNSIAWKGKVGDDGFEAKRVVNRLNKSWWSLVQLIEHAPPPDGQMYVIGTAPCANCDDRLVRVFSHDGHGSHTLVWWHLAPEDTAERLVRGDKDHAVPSRDKAGYEDVIPPVSYSTYYEAHLPQPAR